MQVFRIETEEAGGPYNSRTCDLISWKGVETQPEPREDGLRLDPCGDRDTHYGFLSVPSLCQWWNVDDLSGLRCNYPMFLAIYEAPEVKVGTSGRQATFCFSQAVLVSRTPLADFIKREKET